MAVERDATSMEGTSSVLFARPGREDELIAAITRYMQALTADPDLIFVDLHATKHANKFVLLEMYRDPAARARQPATDHGRSWNEAAASLLTDETIIERILPVMSLSPNCARPNTDEEALEPRPIVCTVAGDAEPFGAFVRIFPRTATEPEFMPIVQRQGEIVAEKEPGYLFADFYRFDSPDRMLVLEYYDDRRSFSHHHTMEHTSEFVRIKEAGDYEAQKHQAFTIRPRESLGPFARSFEVDATTSVRLPEDE